MAFNCVAHSLAGKISKGPCQLIQQEITGVLLGLVIGAKHQMTIEPQLGGNQRRRPAVITLHATTGHEGLKAVLQRVCGNKLQFTNFIAGQCGAR